MYMYVYAHNFILFIYLLGVDVASKHRPAAVISSNIERIYWETLSFMQNHGVERCGLLKKGFFKSNFDTGSFISFT